MGKLLLTEIRWELIKLEKEKEKITALPFTFFFKKSTSLSENINLEHKWLDYICEKT